MRARERRFGASVMTSSKGRGRSASRRQSLAHGITVTRGWRAFQDASMGRIAVTSDISATAMDIAQTVFEVKDGRHFEAAVREFVSVLQEVPTARLATSPLGRFKCCNTWRSVISRSRNAWRKTPIDRLSSSAWQRRFMRHPPSARRLGPLAAALRRALTRLRF